MKDELVYYIHDQSDSLRFQLAGDLTRETTRDLEQARQTAWSVIGGRSLIVDVTNVKSADEGGHEFLEQWHATGAQFIVKSSDAQLRIESISKLPVTLSGRSTGTAAWMPIWAAKWLTTALYLVR
jgi:ABC-type transporter Mla MlaB component